MDTNTRICGFCFYRFTYEELPDGSACFLGIAVCADCMKTEKTAEFRRLFDEEPLAAHEKNIQIWIEVVEEMMSEGNQYAKIEGKNKW